MVERRVEGRSSRRGTRRWVRKAVPESLPQNKGAQLPRKHRWNKGSEKRMKTLIQNKWYPQRDGFLLLI